MQNYPKVKEKEKKSLTKIQIQKYPVEKILIKLNTLHLTIDYRNPHHHHFSSSSSLLFLIFHSFLCLGHKLVPKNGDQAIDTMESETASRISSRQMVNRHIAI